jgi:lipopolysaccharide/colanic/teichoic acid biosynthesis glycosyltransferase
VLTVTDSFAAYPVRDDTSRRVLNVVVAVVGLIVAAPLMLLVAIAVRLESPGPVIYRQRRVGIDRRGDGGAGVAEDRRASAGEDAAGRRVIRDRRTDEARRAHGDRRSSEGRRADDLGGRIFTIYKFRTMTTDTGTASERWATKNDARITRLGRVLRATRIDEIPQLVNVLKGDMNIVGPRPEQPKIFAELRTELTEYPDRQKVLPGITGWAQVNLGYDTSIEDVRKKVALDLEYISRRSAAEDLMIMARTMPVMIMRKVWM